MILRVITKRAPYNTVYCREDTTYLQSERAVRPAEYQYVYMLS